MISNTFDDTGKWLRAVNEFEHDDPEQAPTYRQFVNLGGVILVTPETAKALAAELELEPA